MKELSALISSIRKENKMSNDDLLMFLEKAIGEEMDSRCTYRKLYEKAYGCHLNRSTAEDWVEGLDVTDGSGRESGEKWTVSQTVDMGNKLNVNWNRINEYEWYAAMNAWYSDFFRTARKYELDSEAEFFADLVIDYFLNDTDAKNKSVFNYYFEHVV